MPSQKIRILLLGSGGREDALFETLRKSPLVKAVIVAPGNAGVPHKLRRRLNLGANAAELLPQILELARSEHIDFVVVGPEKPLVDGIVDYFAEHAPEITVFGPSKAAARLEGSKIFFKEFCTRHDLPTAAYQVARTERELIDALSAHAGTWDEPPVIKADGLCAGKGVVVTQSAAEGLMVGRDFIVEGIHGEAGRAVVVEKRLDGTECSAMALCDGSGVLTLQPARDYKRAYPGKDAPNTGGMGAYSPLPDLPVDGPEYRQVQHLLLRLVQAMVKEGCPYHGLLYAGIMLTKDGPMLLEVNCRFGDPETQVVLPRLESDLVPALIASTEFEGFQRQKVLSLRWKKDAAVCVVMTSGGYPGKYDTGFPIRGLEDATAVPGVTVFEAGTELKEGRKVTNGGRVLNIVGVGRDFSVAQAMAYDGVSRIFWAKEAHRSDIADGVQ